MPKKKQSENYDAIGGIYDFLFAESRKPKVKRRPVKLENLPDTTGVLTDALVSSLASPATFMTDQIAREMNSALDIKLGSVKFEEDGELKFTTKGIVDLIKDPAGFVQKAIDDQKADRKAARAAFLGATMMDFVVTGWAQKYGNADVRAAALANTQAAQQSESYKVARAMGQSMRGGSSYPTHFDYMSQRSLDLIGRQTFGSAWETMSSSDKSEFTQILSGGRGALETIGRIDHGPAWASMSDTQKSTYKKSASQSGEFSQESIQRYLAKKYGQNEARNFGRVTSKFVGGTSSESIDILDAKKGVKLYRTLEKQHLYERIGALRNVAPGSPQAEERRTYEKMLLAINMSEKTIPVLSSEIVKLRGQISSERDPQKRRLLEDKLADSQDILKNINRGLFASKIGQWEGYINSLKNVWLSKDGTGLFENIINGNFFREDNNKILNPVEQKLVGDLKINIAKTDKSGLLSAYNEMGETLYYLTPGSLFKTVFYNGEGFARMAYKHMGAVNGMLSKSSLFDGLKESMFEEMMSANIQDYGKLVDDMMKKVLMANKGSGKILTQDQLENLRKLLEKSASFRKLGEAFSYPFKFQQAINKVISNRLEGIRRKIQEAILNNPKLRDLLVRTGAEKLLGKWVVGGGIRVLMQSLVTAVVGALGMTFGPIASAVTSVLTYIATDLLMKMLKGVLVILKYMALGIVAIFAIVLFLGTMIVGKFNKTNYTYTNVAPGDVLICDAYGGQPIGPGPGEPPYETGCIDGNETIHEIYNRVASEMGIGTSLELITCPGHDYCDDIDWAWCYSAGSIYCRADRIGGASCPTLERLFIHELLHQVQSRNSGGIYGTLLREWGADYLSNNGGGYSFNTAAGCIRATETPMLSSCDAATLAAIAQSEGWAYETDCRRALSSYITGFCSR